MTTINTAADLIRLLEENDEFRHAVRRHILSAELIRLPEQFASFVTDQQQFHRQVVQRFDKVDQRFDKVDQRLDKVDQRLDKVDQRFDKVDQRFDRIDRNMGQIKFGHALFSTERNAVLIADMLDLDWQRTLNQKALSRIARDLQLNRNERISFIQADLVLEVVDQDGAEYYLAVEVSFTADTRDTDRAKRNANFLELSTGLPGIAAIASVHNDHSVQSLVKSGEVRWIEITDQMMEVH